MRRTLIVGAAALLLVGCSQASPAPPTRTATGSAVAGPSSAATTQIAPAPPTLRVRPAGFRLPASFGREAVINTGQYQIVAGGLTGGDTSIATTYRIDLQRRRVIPMPSLPVSVHDTAGGLANGVPLVIGGGNASEQSVVQGWDGRRWLVVGHLPQPRSDIVAATVDGRVIVLGGYNGLRAAEPDILSSSNGHRWKTIGRLPVPVRYPASVLSDGTIWLFGGEIRGVMQNAIQRINPTTGDAQVVGRLPTRLGHAAAIPLRHRILIAGGRTAADKVTSRMWWFDPRTHSVRTAGRLHHPLADSAVAQSGDDFYLIGGETPSVTNSILKITYR
jgi:hypothetical protein